MNLTHIVRDFLFKHKLLKASILIGLSGGPDSMALLDSLLENRRNFPDLKLAAAHVDHCWRKNSTLEAERLEAHVKGYGIPWHLLTLNPLEMKGNLEDACRQARLTFFQKLCETHGYQGVALGHHADDQAETVLKRLLEGSALISVKGIIPQSNYQGLTIWRPFLEIKKKEILSRIRTSQLEVIEDPTNLDVKYTRAKMRTQIIPYLSDTFGKEITGPLCRMGNEFEELDQFIKTILDEYAYQKETGWMGWMMDLSSLSQQHSFVVKHAVYKLFKEDSITLSYEQLNAISRDLAEGAAGKHYFVQNKEIHLDRKRIFVINQMEKRLPPKKIQLAKGTHQWGPWKIDVVESESTDALNTGWISIWKGAANVTLPEGEYTLDLGHSKAIYQPENKELGRWWTELKVPAFVRNISPVIWKEGKVAAEFLGPEIHLNNASIKQWNISVKIEA